MRDIDAKMRLHEAPQQQQQQQQQPPQQQQQQQLQQQQQQQPQQPQQQFQRSFSTPSGAGNYDAQTALRVRRWIDSKTVTNVADCRPILNAEIQIGFALKKTGAGAMNDRSAPRF
jgi:hypothetical protein